MNRNIIVNVFFFLVSVLSCNNHKSEVKGNQNGIDESLIKTDYDTMMNTSFKNKDSLIDLKLTQSQHKIIVCEKCNTEVIRKKDSNIEYLEEVDILEFLCIIDKSCTNNIEFSEYANDILFKIIKLYPKDFINVISTNDDLDTEYIYNELSNPLLDYNLQQIIIDINKVNKDNEIKKRILSALRDASLLN